MTKWLTYLGILMVLIVITVLAISGTKASFLIVDECAYEYHPCTVAEKYTQLFHGNKKPIQPFPVTKETLPEGLVWHDGSEQKPFADPNAKRGGTITSYITTFPQTLRQRGMNANTSFRSYLDNNDLALLDIHPTTEEFYPSLATEWAIGPDKRTVYFRLDPRARWSDGVPVTADDYVFMVKLYRAPGIVDPWTNNYFTEYVEDVLKFDDYTIAIRVPTRQANIVYSTIMAPEPYHFYGPFLEREHTFRGNSAYFRYKNNHLPIPDDLKYYQIQENIGSLEAFIVSMQGKLETYPNVPEDLPIDDTISRDDLLQQVLDARAAAAKLMDALPQMNKAAAIPSLKKLTLDLHTFAKQLALFEPDEEENKIDHTILLDDVADGWNKTFNWRAKPNTGAYQVARYMQGKWVLFKRNEHWWADNHPFYKHRYNPDYLRYRLIPKMEIAFEYFKQGELDAFGLTIAEYWYKKAADISQYENGYVQKHWFWNNIPRPTRLISLNLDVDILKDRNVRLGIAHALNMQKVIDLAMLGDARQADTISTGYGESTNLDIKARPFDVDQAIRYLEQAGWTKIGPDGIRVKNGQRLSIKLLYFSPVEKQYIMILKEEAAKAGIEFKPDTYDANTVFKFVQDKKHEMVWHGWAPRSNLNGPTYYGSYHGNNAGIPNNNNFCNFSDPEVDRLIETYRNSNDIEERHKLSKEIQALIHEACCSIPTYYIPFSRIATWRWIRIPDCAEQPTSETLLDYGLYWIDEEMKKETLEAMNTGKTYPQELRIYDTYKPQSAE